MNILTEQTSLKSADQVYQYIKASTHSSSLFAQSNIQAVLARYSKDLTEETPVRLLNYPDGGTVVADGRVVDAGLNGDIAYSYAYVPLGIITSGEIAVIKGGKATKRLSVGDFIGLFETSDWLLTGKRREVGDWTLRAGHGTEILFFSGPVLLAESRSAQSFREYLTNIARQDIVPQPISQLPLLDWVASHTTRSRLKDYAIVINTHLLPNYLPFFRHLAHLVPFGRIFVLEKAYSTVPSAYRTLIEAGCEVVTVKMEPGVPYDYAAQKSLSSLWNKVVEEQKRTGFTKLLIISDGGDLLTSIPWSQLEGVAIAGVEQTQRGIARTEDTQLPLPPIVSVATTGIKKQLESIFIAQSVVAKLQGLGLPAENQRVGIIGYGSIGSTIANELKMLGYMVTYYDSQHSETESSDETKISLDALLHDNDLVIGTTGKDALKGIAFDRIRGHKVLVSASSADVEFYTLLKLAPATNAPFDTRSFTVRDGLTVDILNGGYPINFDRQQNAVPDHDIVLTYSLMYIAAMQAVALIESNELQSRIYHLDLLAQRNLLHQWLRIKERMGEKNQLTSEDVDRLIKLNSAKNVVDGPDVWID